MHRWPNCWPMYRSKTPANEHQEIVMSQTTVLVIDDSATIRRLVDSHLGQAGYRVVLATNAEEGVALAAELRPDLILLDHQLPGTTGYHVCKQLIQLEHLKHTPVVV